MVQRVLKFLHPVRAADGSRASPGMGAGGQPACKEVAAPAITFAMVPMTSAVSHRLAAGVRRAPASLTAGSPGHLRSLWVCGFAAIVLLRFRGWRRIRAAVRSSAPVDTFGHHAGSLFARPAGTRRSGIVPSHPALARRHPGTPAAGAQWEAVLAHELCHVRRRDNLTSAIHMIVEAVFWFHPLVWWIGARLVEERERACDEAVLSLGNEPRDYAEAILNICKSYVESPLACRLRSNRVQSEKANPGDRGGGRPGRVNLRKKLALAACRRSRALVVPMVVGVISAAHIRAQSQGVAPPKFETASIKSCGRL